MYELASTYLKQVLTNRVRTLFGGASYLRALSPDFIVSLDFVSYREFARIYSFNVLLSLLTMTMNSSATSGPPPGASGKDTSNLQQETGRVLSRNEIEMMTGTIGRKSASNIDAVNRDAIIGENAVRARRNEWKAVARVDSGYLEDVSDDEEMLEVPPIEHNYARMTRRIELTAEEKILKVASALGGLTPTTKGLMSDLVKKGLGLLTTDVTAQNAEATASTTQDDASEAPVFTIENTIRASATTSAYEIPRPLINLARSKVHIPLTLLTTASIRRIHTDPSCVKMKKGLVMDDPKRSIMDTSFGFPVETSLLPGQFNEAYKNFLKLLAKVTDKSIVQEFREHRDFLTEHDDFNDQFDMILAFDIEIRCKYFNNHTLLDEGAYKQCWNEVKIDTKLARQEQATANSSGSSNRYQPYPPHRNDAQTGPSNAMSDGKPFRKGKGEHTSSDSLLCIICGQNGHKSNNCTHTQTHKGSATICAVFFDK
jgi:hypothetical protein